MAFTDIRLEPRMPNEPLHHGEAFGFKELTDYAQGLRIEKDELRDASSRSFGSSEALVQRLCDVYDKGYGEYNTSNNVLRIERRNEYVRDALRQIAMEVLSVFLRKRSQ